MVCMVCECVCEGEDGEMEGNVFIYFSAYLIFCITCDLGVIIFFEQVCLHNDLLRGAHHCRLPPPALCPV